MTFGAKLAAAAARHGSWLCIGLDPEPGRLPAVLRGEADPVARFCREIIAATADVVCAFKPNSGFFEAQGTDGMQRLAGVIAAVPAGVPVILDAKRGDIGSTAEAYARAAFDVLGADAVTLSPYLGGDALAPFLARRDRGCFILCRTSNPGGAEVQQLRLEDGRPLYLEIARRAAYEWNAAGNVGLVVGATFPAEAAAVRALCPAVPLLVPGIGAQGGDLAAAVRATRDASGGGALVNVSRSILYAGAGADFADAARREALRLRAAIAAAARD
ncbi:MAG: orotidine-5'-phosphate decarboxylase [Chloroflexi bacterium]|nr:orotidine-5'-phosphate decarboxylase [Chloroflexota bacterium]